MWISRFEWPKGTQSATESFLATAFSTLKAANFNSVFLQVRGQCETLYPSPNEPWGTQFGYSDPGYDPLAYAVSQAHANGLELHAYINTHVITQGTNAPPQGLNPPHPFWLHGDPSTPGHDDWCYVDSTGTTPTLGSSESGYDWASQGVPAFNVWTREQILHVARTYNVDGVHFDRIRVPGDGSHDPTSIARQAGPGNPARLAYQAWTRDQIARFCNEVYGAVAEVNASRPAGKPRVRVSSAPFGLVSSQLSVNQDVNAWTSLGAMGLHLPDDLHIVGHHVRLAPPGQPRPRQRTLGRGRHGQDLGGDNGHAVQRGS